MEKFKYIGNQNGSCRCYFCGTTKSVKYMMEIVDPVIDNKPTEVTVCNRCAAIFGSNEK